MLGAMCMFVGRVKYVSNTRIFARREASEQILVYEMKMSSENDNAMVLPLPVPPNSPESAVEFVNLEKYPRMFASLDALFPTLDALSFASGPSRGGKPRLAVVDVGAFEASFVPTVADFSRLDPRFHLPKDVWDALPDYQDWGFAVFKLRGGEQHVHPMAFRFATRFLDRLYFPTVHVHDGSVPEFAEFDHTLFCQAVAPGDVAMAAAARRSATGVERTLEWERSHEALALSTLPKPAQDALPADLIDFGAPVWRVILDRAYANRDVFVTPGS